MTRYVLLQASDFCARPAPPRLALRIYGIIDQLTYAYAANGNLTTDHHKKATFAYNHLNLPRSIVFTTTTPNPKIEWLYDAAGMKLTKKLYSGTTLTGSKNYINGIEYNGANLEAIYHADGRLLPNGAAWHYDYTLKDHLGNARVTFRASGSTWTNVEEMHYYPFGMQMENAGTANPTNKYLYNGKERNEDFGLNLSDYGARWYDAAVGRWWSVDSLAPDANQIDKTPYQYGWNNPVRYNDPDGNCPWCLGAIAGALVEYGTQVATNYAQGKDNPFTANINVAAIGVAAAEGGLTSGASAGRKLLVKAGAAVVNNAVEVKTTESGSLETKVETNISNIAKNAAIDLGTDGLVKTVAPTAKGVQNGLSKVGVNTGTVKKGVQNVAAATNTRVSSSTATQTANQAVKGSSKAVSEGAKGAIKATSNGTKDKIKEKINVGGA